MIGLVIVGHGDLPAALLSALVHIVGETPGATAFRVDPDEDLEALRTRMLGTVRGVDAGAGVLIATDVFGSTPANVALSCMDLGSVEVVSGANLPMLIRFCEARDAETLPAAAEIARDAGQRYIRLAECRPAVRAA